MTEQAEQQHTHHINVYEHGKWIGHLTPSGGTNRLRVHASLLTETQAARICDEANADPENIKNGLTCKAASAWPIGRGR